MLAITLSAFTLIPYSMVLLQLRVFYAREQPWTPIILIVVITAVKIAGSLVAPHLTDNPDLVAGYLGLANGLGFLAGATVGHVLLRSSLRPPSGHLVSRPVVRTILVTITASLGAGLIAHIADQLLGLASLTAHLGAGGSLLRLLALGLIMVPIIVWVLVAARVPEAQAALAVVRRRLGRPSATPGGVVAAQAVARPVQPRRPATVPYPDQRNSSPRRRPPTPAPTLGGAPASVAGAGMRKGPPVTDESADGPAPGPEGTATRKLPRPTPDDFRPDVPDTADPHEAADEPEPDTSSGGPPNGVTAVIDTGGSGTTTREACRA